MAGDLAAEAGGATTAVPLVTMGDNALMALGESPALESSAADPYGRLATIFVAVAAPIPGTFSSSASLAVFKLTGAAGATLAADFFFAAATGAAAGAWAFTICGDNASKPTRRKWVR